MSSYLFYIDVLKNQGGAQRVMSNLIKYFQEKGEEVYLVTDYNDDSSFYDELVIDKEHYFTLDIRKKNKLAKNINEIRKLKKIILNLRPTFCISFLGMPNIRMLLATKHLNVKRIVSVRSDPNVEYGKNFFTKLFVNHLFKFANGIILQTAYVLSYFNKKIQLKCKVIFNPVNCSIYDLNRAKTQKNIVTFGSLLECKNHKMLIDAYNLVRNEFPDDKLIIYGQGSLKLYLNDYISKLGLSGKVELGGHVNNVAEILCNSKMFVLTSNYEGMPNALMEAMATGTPCISTDCPSGGPKTLITNENEGVLVKCGDYKELASKMLLLKDESIRDKLSTGEKQRALIFKGDTILIEWDNYLSSLIV